MHLLYYGDKYLTPEYIRCILKGEKMENKIMILDEVADYLRVSIRTVYRWIKNRGLPVHKIGGLDRVNKMELDEWFAEYKVN